MKDPELEQMSAVSEMSDPAVSPSAAVPTTAPITAPRPSNGLPSSIPYIIANEAAERFSFYGMSAILMVYLSGSAYLAMPEKEAAGWIHLFRGSVYLFPLLGAFLADIFFGKFRIMFWLSLVYCLGHLALALPDCSQNFDPRTFLFIGLALIALGSGGIKSCTSAIVGDQFNAENQHLLNRVYHWFYLAINFGSFFSMLLTPWLLKHYGPGWAFGVPGILMACATLILWLGRNKYRIVKPVGWKIFDDLKNRECLGSLGRISIVFGFLILFWAVYDQTATTWVKQAEEMNAKIFASLTFLPENIRNFELLPSQLQALNPFLILILIPIFTYGIYPVWHRLWGHSTLKKIAVGLFLTVIAQCFPLAFAIAENRGIVLNLAWQVPAYFILTTAEVLVSITALEFAYTQSPRSMKSIVMGAFLLTTTCGNFFVAGVNFLREKYEGFLSGSNYELFFLILSLVNALFFLLVVRFYKEKTILQD